MAKWIFLVILLAAAYIFWQRIGESGLNQAPQVQDVPQKTGEVVESESIFVPYWNIPTNFTSEPYDRYFYFGVSVDKEGIAKSEEGYRALSTYQSRAGDQESYLTIRMLDSETNLRILENVAAQEKIIGESLALAQLYGFEGVVLDLELAALPFSNVMHDINSFVDRLSTASRESNMKLFVAMYGDVFYRSRPFDVEHIASQADEILIMAYDYHKSYGEPGPNFPLEGRKTYGYDFKLMTEDYLRVVPPDKLTVIFGMYGYDWVVDEKKRPLKRATALSLTDIENNFVDQCNWQNCLVLPDAPSAETEINYVDSSTSPVANHIIWYEDERSVGVKKAYLKTKGIGRSAYWVYGYF